MGLLNINNGVSQKKGINYTVIIDNINDDFGDVSNDTYFLDNETQLVYYKNTTGGLVSIFEQGGSGNTIYSADDSLSEDRTVSVGTNTLTFSTANGTSKLSDFSGSVQGIHQTIQCAAGSNKSVAYSLNVGVYSAGIAMYGSTARTDLANKTFLTGGYNHGPLVVGNNGGSDAGEIWFNISNGSTEDGTISKRRAKITKDDFKIHNVTGFIYHPTDDEPTKIGTENVSLQGDTLISEKLELSSKENGILLNRVDDSEMAAITGMGDNEIVFNKTKNALYRYDLPTTSWVALAAGFGIVGTTDATGKPTFYATVGDAYTNGTGSIKLYTDITESVSRTLNIIDGKDIDLNGFTYTYAATDGSHMFEDNTGPCTFRIINGRLIRSNGTTSGEMFNFNLGHTQIDIVNVYAENTVGRCLYLKPVTFNGTGSTFISNSNGNSITFCTNIKGGTYISNASSNSFQATNIVEVTCKAENSTGRNFINGTVFNSEFYATTHTGLQLTGVSNASNCYIKSTTGNGIVGGGTTQKAINCTVISDTGSAAYRIKLIDCYLESAASLRVVTDCPLVEGCNIVNTSTTSSGGLNTAAVCAFAKIINNVFELAGDGNAIALGNSSAATITNNTIKVSNSSAIAINQGTYDAYMSGNVIEGSTNLINATTGVNLWNGAMDIYGNVIRDGSDEFEVPTKLILSGKDHGVLLPRVTTPEMNSISASDNEIVYNTELESLYRYDDPSGTWIALASGYGMVGVVRDSDNGVPTFYSDLQSALDTCKTVGSYNTVTLYSNHTTTTGIIIDNTFEYKHLTINFNGFKIENNQADDTHCLSVGGLIAGTTTVLLDGSLIRENGTTGKCLQYDLSTRKINMSKMYIYNENYITLQLGGGGETYDFGGSIFETGPSATLNTLRLSYDTFKNFTVISNSSIDALFLTNSAKATDFTVINKSTGSGVVTQVGCIASNFYAESNSGDAVGGGHFSNFVAKSVSGRAVNSPTEAHNFVATTGDNIAVNIGSGEVFSNFSAENNSSTHACVRLSNTKECVQVYAKNKGSGYAIWVSRNQINNSFSYNKITAISDGGIAANLTSNPGFKILFSHCEFVSKWNDVGGHSVRISGDDTVLVNCSFRVNNVGANNITSDSVITTKVANSTFDGATTPINTNVTLSNSFTSDPYGNVTL